MAVTPTQAVGGTIASASAGAIFAHSLTHASKHIAQGAACSSACPPAMIAGAAVAAGLFLTAVLIESCIDSPPERA
jgi:hypothetical protein